MHIYQYHQFYETWCFLQTGSDSITFLSGSGFDQITNWLSSLFFFGKISTIHFLKHRCFNFSIFVNWPGIFWEIFSLQRESIFFCIYFCSRLKKMMQNTMCFVIQKGSCKFRNKVFSSSDNPLSVWGLFYKRVSSEYCACFPMFIVVYCLSGSWSGSKELKTRIRVQVKP